MIITSRKLFYFIVLLFFNYCSYSQVNKIVLTRESGGEFRKDKITITLDKTVSKMASGGCHTDNSEDCLLYSEKNNVCNFCRHFRGRAMKETRIIKREKKIIEKTDFYSLVNAIESLNISELEENNNMQYYHFFWYPPTMKLELYENEVNIFSFEYISAPNVPDFPPSLLPLNTIAKDIFKLAGIKSKKYCIK